MRLKVLLLLGMMMVALAGRSEAFIINEILADPATGIAGDANADGISSSNDDEFIELYNPGEQLLDVSGWSLADAVKTRHVFSANSMIAPHGLLVVFGGGNPTLPAGTWQSASTGMLSLNNSGDSITLFDQQNQLVEQVIYGTEAGRDESIVRSPEGSGEIFVLHSALPNSKDSRFSPGYLVNPPQSAAVVPELPTLVLMGLGMLLRKRW